MEAVVSGFGKEGTRAEFTKVAARISVFNSLSMMDLDKQHCANPQSIVALFQEFHRLITAHFEAECYFSSKEEQAQLVPAYTISDYVFTTHDLKRIASGGEKRMPYEKSSLSVCHACFFHSFSFSSHCFKTAPLSHPFYSQSLSVIFFFVSALYHPHTFIFPQLRARRKTWAPLFPNATMCSVNMRQTRVGLGFALAGLAVLIF